MPGSAQLPRPSPRGAQNPEGAPRQERMRCTNCGQIAAFTHVRREPACASCGNSGFRDA
jgi:hypothetical protein